MTSLCAHIRGKQTIFGCSIPGAKLKNAISSSQNLPVQKHSSMAVRHGRHAAAMQTFAIPTPVAASTTALSDGTTSTAAQGASQVAAVAIGCVSS